MYREFIVPDDEEILDLIGEWPDTVDSGARLLTWQGSEGDSLTFSYDTLSRSVRARWTSGNGDELLDLYREGATRLRVSSTASATYISVEFHMGECAGEVVIQASPKLSVQDRLLYV
ncbi:hypothetical protein GCM10018980_65220 [Streptomyces capoamus]|uniref:YD repeat-containing protein n=1 Tax=Streptomyces capoamus TaxID=68183 RepID=A0A919KEW2_9ACTN|nr:hypothetical protein [Streptomyces capoamus]GGP31353.1 hypothetical protein GCM10010501_72050 [Streptomyces libani subsp. rufus]GHG70554.1 hypothetical protein GCM10018980_65220 [Streptomyces capoamus]